ncbi:alkaline phosphatase D family protein [Hansschlegelia sp. KR7-227]|uniref:alkaline phosphatase D family protein n=1 Tax=Hansschlegelia sp. KR7-227 TaxID=3400914 RepID=UPI003C0BE859
MSGSGFLHRPSRRTILTGAAVAAGGAAFPSPLLALGRRRPETPSGVQSGDVGADRAIVWSRTDRPARMVVEWSTTESFKKTTRIVGPDALGDADFTARVDLRRLPAGEDIFYRVSFQDLRDVAAVSEPVVGRFRTAPAKRRDVSFVWTGDTAGQGWGINPDFGGMKGYEAMRRTKPDFFIHSGDTVYADGPLSETVDLGDGRVWKNLVTEAKSKVAETLREYRGQHSYNLMDENIRRMNAEVPMFAQWDDHETTNNWYPQEILDLPAYREKSVALLAARARRAFFDYMPIRIEQRDPQRIYRQASYGPHLDVFFLDMRSYRGPNSANLQTTRSDAAAILGAEQVRWLKRKLLDSRATWKVIASDMPIGLEVPDGTNWEAVANGEDGRAKGREIEIADLLRFIKRREIKNTVWITADVHYAAAHRYHPNRAKFQDFDPFWEFVAGPINSGTFGPNALDMTFGPKVMFQKAALAGKPNASPLDGLQFFGHVAIEGRTGVMTVSLKDLDGADIYKVDLNPKA